MPEADPKSLNSQIKTAHLKALAHSSNQLIAALNTLSINASEDLAATLDALNKQLASSLDSANKTMGTRLEIHPLQTGANYIVLQQTAKVTQTRPPAAP